MAIRIVDVTDEPTFALVPPCADPGFDHRTCDYWEDADRGSKAARLVVARTAAARRRRAARRRGTRSATTTTSRRSTRSRRPGASRSTRSPTTTSAPETRSRPRRRPARRSPPTRRPSSGCSPGAWPSSAATPRCCSRTTSPSRTPSSGRCPRTRGRCGPASCTRACPSRRCRRSSPASPRHLRPATAGSRRARGGRLRRPRGAASRRSRRTRRWAHARTRRAPHAGVLGGPGVRRRGPRRAVPGHAPRAGVRRRPRADRPGAPRDRRCVLRRRVVRLPATGPTPAAAPARLHRRRIAAAPRPPPSAVPSERRSPRSPGVTGTRRSPSRTRSLLAILPGDVDGVARRRWSRQAFADATPTRRSPPASRPPRSPSSLARRTTSRPASSRSSVPGAYSETFFRDWRETYDAGACAQAGGVAGTRRDELGGGPSTSRPVPAACGCTTRGSRSAASGLASPSATTASASSYGRLRP